MFRTINPATGEPVWWMKGILALAFVAVVSAFVWSCFTFGAPITVATIILPIVAFIALGEAIWGL